MEVGQAVRLAGAHSARAWAAKRPGSAAASAMIRSARLSASAGSYKQGCPNRKISGGAWCQQNSCHTVATACDDTAIVQTRAATQAAQEPCSEREVLH